MLFFLRLHFFSKYFLIFPFLWLIVLSPYQRNIFSFLKEPFFVDTHINLRFVFRCLKFQIVICFILGQCSNLTYLKCMVSFSGTLCYLLYFLTFPRLEIHIVTSSALDRLLCLWNFLFVQKWVVLKKLYFVFNFGKNNRI